MDDYESTTQPTDGAEPTGEQLIQAFDREAAEDLIDETRGERAPLPPMTGAEAAAAIDAALEESAPARPVAELLGGPKTEPAAPSEPPPPVPTPQLTRRVKARRVRRKDGR